MKIFPSEFAFLFSLWGLTDLFYRFLQLEYSDFVNDGAKSGDKWGRKKAMAAFYKESGYQYTTIGDAIRDRNELIIDKEKEVVPKWYQDWEKWENK